MRVSAASVLTLTPISKGTWVHQPSSGLTCYSQAHLLCTFVTHPLNYGTPLWHSPIYTGGDYPGQSLWGGGPRNHLRLLQILLPWARARVCTTGKELGLWGDWLSRKGGGNSFS